MPLEAKKFGIGIYSFSKKYACETSGFIESLKVGGKKKIKKAKKKKS
jgi:hypothetical protein